jgi:hypothetical protein
MDYSEDEMNMDGVDEVEPIIEPKKLPKHWQFVGPIAELLHNLTPYCHYS